MQIKINQLVVTDLENFSDAVLKVHWMIGEELLRTYEDGTHIIVSKSGQSILSEPTNLENFTSFENLTEEQVITWIENKPEFLAAQEDLTKEKIKLDCPANLIKPNPWE